MELGIATDTGIDSGSEQDSWKSAIRIGPERPVEAVIAGKVNQMGVL